MNQAGSENKCSKRISNESILNNYNFDDVSTDQNSNCENCKQKRCTVCDKHSCHIGTVISNTTDYRIRNTEHLVEVAKLNQQQKQTDTNLCPQSLLQKAWVCLQSVITTRMNSCPRCNPKSPSSTCVKTPSQSSLVSFLSSISSPSPSPSASSSTSRLQPCLSCMTSCHRGRSPCSRALSPCCIARPPCSRTFHPCLKSPSTCPDVKLSTPITKQTYSKPNTKSPNVHSKLNFTKPKTAQTSSDTEPICPHAKPPCHNARCINPKCPIAKSSCKNLEPPCSYATPPCPNAKCPNAKPSCPSLQAPCPHTKPPSTKDKPPCSKAKCPNAKPSCPSLLPPCPKANRIKNCEHLCENSKTSLYHSFSNESLCGKCKESLVELAKVYINKLTSDHKLRCPRCAKRPARANSKETLTSYLRSIFDQAWSYFNRSTEQKTCPPQAVLSNCSITSTSSKVSESLEHPEIIELDKPRCYCQKSPKTQSCESTFCPKSVSTPKCVTISDTAVICPTCLTPITSTKSATYPKPVSCPVCLKSATCDKPATCSMFYKFKGNTAPAQSSKEEGTHEHKSCSTSCRMHNSNSVQQSYFMSDKSCWSSQTSMAPITIIPRQIKIPQSVEELKASITGVTSGIMPGCEILDFRSAVEYSKPCVQDLKVSKKLISEEASIPSSGGTKTDEVLLENVFENPREQMHNKENICKSGSKSMTCVDSKNSNTKGKVLFYILR